MRWSCSRRRAKMRCGGHIGVTSKTLARLRNQLAVAMDRTIAACSCWVSLRKEKTPIPFFSRELVADVKCRSDE